MAKPHPTQHTVRSARQAIPPAFDLMTPHRTAVAVRSALLFGLAFGALAIVTPPVLAQTPGSRCERETVAFVRRGGGDDAADSDRRG
jgi:hypothetical protein